MKKAAIFGIIAAFIVIALLIFLPVVVKLGGEPVESASVSDGTNEITDTNGETASETVSGITTDPDTTVRITDTTGPDETVTEDTTGSADDTTEPDNTAAPETTTEEEITTAPETTTEEEITTAPETTTEAETTTVAVEPLDPEKKYVAFTFDDGPDAKRSKLITDKMLEYGGKCTFFVIGNLIKGDREKGMQYAYENGMEIGLHCWSHDYYYTKNPEKYEEEVYQGAEAIKKSIGVWPTLMRPPGGNITEEQYKSCEFPVIIWSIDTEDWKHKKNTDENPKSENIQTIVRNALYGGKEATEANFKVKNGDIILMHEIYENSYDAFCIIIEELHNRGFEFVTVSELLQNPAPGCKYYSATYKKG